MFSREEGNLIPIESLYNIFPYFLQTPSKVFGAFGPDICKTPLLKVAEGGFTAPLDSKVAERRSAEGLGFRVQG